MTLESIEPDKRQLGLEAITKYLDNQIIHPSHYCAEGLRELALSVELGKLLTRHSGGGWEVRIDPLQDCVANARRSCALADWTLRRLPRIARSIGATLPEFAWEYIDEALERPPCGVGKSTIGKEFRDWFICHLITIVQQATDLPLLPSEYESLNCADIVAGAVENMPCLNLKKPNAALSAKSISGIWKKRDTKGHYRPALRSPL